MQYIIRFLFTFLGYFPLPILHILGNILGDILYLSSPRMRQITATNLSNSEIISDCNKIKSFTRKVIKETVKTSLELTIALTRHPEYISSLFKYTQGRQYLTKALQEQKGILLMTPHLGSFDLAGRYLSEIIPSPVTGIFKPPKQKSLVHIMEHGRERNNAKVATADKKGVRKIYKSLKNKEAVILLPDQVPENGEGIMATFFNYPAYTMTLAAKLANKPNIIPLFFIGERLPYGKGFVLHIFPLKKPLTSDIRHNTQLINDQIETLIKQFPEQYLFSYNRYKIPSGCENK
ncbi:MAG: lysophospholipid acyltransferase family protein [Neisseriaceae bacterium]|nr:MAG: lysophospholipid acyltransferase family protein [Neisseriaceae bacterium]